MAEDIFEQPDFSLDVQDNGKLCFVVLGLTKSSADIVCALVAHLRGLPPFQSPGSTGPLCLRILTELPHWSREEKTKSEGFLNGSKRLFGFLGIAHCHDNDDFIDAESNYKKYLDLISNPLMTSKCLVFGENEDLERSLRGQESFVLMKYDRQNVIPSCSEKLLDVLKHCVAIVHSNLKVILSDKKGLEKAGSLKGTDVPTVMSEEQIKCQQGRSLKAQGDYNILLGDYVAAATLYKESFQLFRPTKENLWLGAVAEGLLSVSLLRSNQYDTLLSFTDAFDAANQRDTFAVDSSGSVTSDSTDQVLFETTAFNGPEGIPVLDVVDTDGILTGDDQIDKDFQLSMSYYNKVSRGIRKPLVEFCFKYASYLVQLKKYSRACEILQEAQGAFDSQSNLKLSFYLVLGSLYRRMKLNRKSTFLIVNAAREAISLSSSIQMNFNINVKAYSLLKYCMSEFNLTDVSNGIDQVKGWPSLQADVIKGFAPLCLELGYNELFIKWSWFLLQHFHSYLSDKYLQKLSTDISRALKNIRSDETEFPAPFPLTSIPHITVFKPQPLSTQLSVKQSVTLFPSLVSSTETTQGPFLFSMIGKKKQSDVLWVQGDPAEVLLIVSNPLALELKVEKMTMTLKGVKVNPYPSNISLPAKCESQQFVLLCIPIEPGQLSISGYTASIYGLSNKSVTPVETTIKVLPSLPQLRAKIYPKDIKQIPVNSRRRSMSVLETDTLLDGEKTLYDFQLQSIGDVPIDMIKVKKKEQKSDYCHITWNEDDLKSMFPLSIKNELYNFPLTVEAKIPSFLRVGSCKVKLQKGGAQGFTSLSNESSKRDSFTETDRKSKTLNISPRESPSKNPGSPSRFKRFQGSFRREPKHADLVEKKAKSSGLLESLDLHSPPHSDSSPLSLNHYGTLPSHRTVTSDTTPVRSRSSIKTTSIKSFKSIMGKPQVNEMPEATSTPNSSELLESLDLHNSPPKSFKSWNQYKTLPSKATLLVGSSSSSIIKGATGISKYVKRFMSKPDSQMSSPVLSTSSQAPPIPLSPSQVPPPSPLSSSRFPLLQQLPSSSDPRLMDSLNLEHPLKENSSTKENAPLNGNINRHSTGIGSYEADTLSDIVNFEFDRTSLKSDPDSSDANSIKSDAAIGTSVKSNDSNILLHHPSLVSTVAAPFKKKKKVGYQSSLPAGIMKPVQSKVSSVPQISLPTTALKVRRQPPKKKKVVTTFLLQYTGGEGSKEGYYREVTVEMSNTIGPSLVFDEFSISAVKGSPDMFSFDFIIENVSSYSFNVSIDIKQEDLPIKKYEWYIQCGSLQQVSLPMKRFTLPDQENSVKEVNIIKKFCEHIVSLLDVKWTSEEKTGTLTLEGLQLPQSALSLIRPIPIIFNVNLDAESYSLGSPVSVTVEITNNTNEVLAPSLITLSPFILSADGQKLDCIKQHHMLYTQSLSQRIPQLNEEGSYSFTLVMIFLYKNEYLIDISHHVYPKGNLSNEGSADKRPESNIVTSPVKPVFNTSSTSMLSTPSITGPLPNDSLEYLTDDASRLSEFIKNSRTYIGPQLTISIT